ncbi:MAG: hypothetical protein ACTS73_07825 [Arsenophonus sp. NEOnobi-MAG3]
MLLFYQFMLIGKKLLAAEQYQPKQISQVCLIFIAECWQIIFIALT